MFYQNYQENVFDFILRPGIGKLLSLKTWQLQSIISNIEGTISLTKLLLFGLRENFISTSLFLSLT